MQLDLVNQCSYDWRGIAQRVQGGQISSKAILLKLSLTVRWQTQPVQSVHKSNQSTKYVSIKSSSRKYLQNTTLVIMCFFVYAVPSEMITTKIITEPTRRQAVRVDWLVFVESPTIRYD